MTIKELYKWARENEYENLQLKYNISWTDYEDFIYGDLKSKHFVFSEPQNAILLLIDAREEVEQ